VRNWYSWAIDIYSETPMPHCFGKVNFSHLLKNHSSERSLIMMNSQASNFTLFIHVQGSMPYHLSIKFPPIAPKDLRTEHRSQSPQIVFFRKLNPCEPKFCYHLSTVFPSCISPIYMLGNHRKFKPSKTYTDFDRNNWMYSL
jgi:hypothetical protein